MNALFHRTAILIGMCNSSRPVNTRLISWRPASCIPWLIVLAAYCQAAETFPYQAQVTSDVADVMSGPGEAFYATDRLAKGSTVEVHRHEQGDWCAIRPPVGSFSWIPVEMLEVEPDGVHARVVSDDAFTYVGSKLSTAHHVEYIPLEPGEQVRLLGSKVLADPQTRKQREWVQVTPPDGEFRWIHRQHLGRVAGSATAAVRRPDSGVVTAASWETADAAPSDEARGTSGTAAEARNTPPADGSPLTAPPQPLRSVDAPDLSTAPRRSTANQSTQPDRPATTPGASRREVASIGDPEPLADVAEPDSSTPEIAEEMWRPRGSSGGTSVQATLASAAAATPADDELADSAADASDTNDANGANDASGANEASGAEELAAAGPLEPLLDATELADQIRALDLELSAMVAQPVEAWDLASLRAAASGLAEQTASDPRADKYLQSLDRRMAQFERVQERYQKLALSGRSTGSAHVNGRPAAAAPRLIGQSGRAQRQLPATLPTANRTRSNGPRSGARDGRVVPAGALAADEAESYRAGTGNSSFDGEGILMPVFTSRTDVPEFALTDRQGRIVLFVSAGDGIELREYVRQRVGIYGTHGFLPALQQQHLTATRVVVLEDSGR
ncbi:MAG: hypothetical protein U0795_05075 [Pirellulales bacterium]